MIPLLKSSPINFILVTGISSLLLLGGAAWSEDAQPEKARALLDQVNKSEQDRQVAVKQTEIDRLKEDQNKTESDSNALKQTIESTSGLLNDASVHLETLTTESRRLQHELAVAEARINAERIKMEGLRMLTEAQGKSVSALARRTEETQARARVRTVELEMLQGGKLVPGEGREDTAHTELLKARKALALAVSKSESEERLAHDAMKAAAAKMTLAETRAATAQRLADNDLTVEQPEAQAKPKAKPAQKPAVKQASETTVQAAAPANPQKLVPIAAPPKPAASTPAPAAAPAKAKH